MAFLAAALPYIAAAGTVVGGVAAANQASQKASILNFNATQSVAAGTQAEANQRIQTSMMQSRLKALAASSGGSATDPTVQGLQTNVGTEGEYRALSKLYQGRAAAQGQTLQAETLKRQEGPDIISGVMGGASTLFSDLRRQNFLTKYGYGGPPSYGYDGYGDPLTTAGVSSG